MSVAGKHKLTIYGHNTKDNFSDATSYTNTWSGWGIGTKEGLTSGGAFYTSGGLSSDASENINGVRINEPWLGLWQDSNITVTCQDGAQLRFNPTNVSKYFPHEDTLGTCQSHELCLESDKCLIQQLGKGVTESENNLEYLKEKVRNSNASLVNSNQPINK